MEDFTMSPVPGVQQDTEEVEVMDYPDAIREVIKGKKVTRKEWKNPTIYGFLNGDVLTLHKSDINYKWIISDGDLMGNDWYVL